MERGNGNLYADHCYDSQHVQHFGRYGNLLCGNRALFILDENMAGV